MEPFKNIYNKNSLTKLAIAIRQADPDFESSLFLDHALQGLNKLELKERVLHIAKSLKEYLKHPYEDSIDILISILAPEEDHLSFEWENNGGISGFLIWPLTTYIELYGLDHFDKSVEAMYEMTKRFSSEFVIRKFILTHEKKMFKILTQWKKDPNHHVRRLVSEGTRPRLPWGISVPCLKENLPRNIKLIYSLRKDPSEYVRRSVANHLNDISHLDQELFIQTLNRFGDSPYEKAIIRHASRTLLKKGNTSILKLHGYDTQHRLKPEVKVLKKSIQEGDNLPIEIKIKNNKKRKLLIDYIIHFKKANGTYSEKVFRLRDLETEKNISIEKHISFKKVTTRRHYPGKHYIQIQINGKRFDKLSFNLKCP